MMYEPVRIMGINPGTRYLGIAIFLGSELREWRIKVFNGKWSKEKMEKIKKTVQGFIEHYDPNILAIKKLHPSRSSKSLKYLVNRIKELSRRKGLKVYKYSIKDIEKFFLPEEKTNKSKMAKVLVSEYPDLFHEFKKEKSNKNPYYIRMFESVALASLSFNRLDK